MHLALSCYAELEGVHAGVIKGPTFLSQSVHVCFSNSAFVKIAPGIKITIVNGQKPLFLLLL